MNELDGVNESDAVKESALDAALAANLPAPTLPLHFRSRLMANVRASALEEQASVRQMLARDAQHKLDELRADFVEVRRRTLGAYIGIAFVAGVITAIVLPSVLQTFGSLGMYAISGVAGAAGLAVGLSWLRRAGWLV